LAREKGWLLTWDDKNQVYVHNRAGQKQAQITLPAPISAACCSDDGAAYITASGPGDLSWLAPDLTPRWQRSLKAKAVALALDAFGQYLAVSDSQGGLHLYDRQGQIIWQVQTARPLHHLTFAPESPHLLGSADFGLVACFDLAGKCVWRDGLVAHCGSLATSANGDRIVLACFTEGLRCYSLKGKNVGRLPASEACRLAALTFDGRLMLAAGLANDLLLIDREGRTLCRHPLETQAVALAVGALGSFAAVALANGTINGLGLPDAT